MFLNEYIKFHRLLRAEFAQRAGISTYALHNYLSGTRLPHLDTALRISKATEGHVSLDEIVEYYNNFRTRNKKKIL